MTTFYEIISEESAYRKHFNTSILDGYDNCIENIYSFAVKPVSVFIRCDSSSISSRLEVDVFNPMLCGTLNKC